MLPVNWVTTLELVKTDLDILSPATGTQQGRSVNKCMERAKPGHMKGRGEEKEADSLGKAARGSVRLSEHCPLLPWPWPWYRRPAAVRSGSWAAGSSCCPAGRGISAWTVFLHLPLQSPKQPGKWPGAAGPSVQLSHWGWKPGCVQGACSSQAGPELWVGSQGDPPQTLRSRHRVTPPLCPNFPLHCLALPPNSPLKLSFQGHLRCPGQKLLLSAHPSPALPAVQATFICP